jgi:hypothetical protein
MPGENKASRWNPCNRRAVCSAVPFQASALISVHPRPKTPNVRPYCITGSTRLPSFITFSVGSATASPS